MAKYVPPAAFIADYYADKKGIVDPYHEAAQQIASYFSTGIAVGSIGETPLDTILAECLNMPACKEYVELDNSLINKNIRSYWLRRLISTQIQTYCIGR